MLESVGKEPSKVKVLDQEEDEGENVLQVQHGIPVETQSESSSDNSESENFEDDSIGYSLLPQEDPISDSDKMEAEREPQVCCSECVLVGIKIVTHNVLWVCGS